MTAVRTGRCARRRARVYARSDAARSSACASTQSASRPAVCRSPSADVADSGKSSGPSMAGVVGASPGATVSGACSTIAWTLVPENPYDDTAARRGPW